ncbi:MAG: TRAP transporter small permease [Sphaerochaeta sp.]|nr:TRAP transporter small permease [Sphaerochaeta sp.]
MGVLLGRLCKNFEVILSACFLSITVGVVILNVILRYVFSSGLFWVEEVATTAFIWSVFIGSAAAYKQKMHIGIDLITKLFSEKVREIIASLINMLMVLINGYVCYLSILMIYANKLKRTPVLSVPSMYVNLAITVGFGLMTIRSIQFLISEGILLVRSKKEMPRESL